MWPKLLIQLAELLPHARHLIPLAQRYLEKGGDAPVLNSLAESVKTDLGRMSSAHASLVRQVQEQNAQLSQISDDVRRLRESVVAVDTRLNEVAEQARKTATLHFVVLGIVLVVAGVLVTLLVLALRR